MIEFYVIFAQKINKIPKVYTIFAPKMPKFCIIIAQKIFFFEIWGARAPWPPPFSYTYARQHPTLTMHALIVSCHNFPTLRYNRRFKIINNDPSMLEAFENWVACTDGLDMLDSGRARHVCSPQGKSGQIHRTAK